MTDFGISDAVAPFNFTLVGIIMGAGRQIAVLKTGLGPAQNVTVGGEIEGWRVTQIESGHIVLHEDSSGKDVKLPLHYGEHTANAPPASAVAQSPQTGIANDGSNSP